FEFHLLFKSNILAKSIKDIYTVSSFIIGSILNLLASDSSFDKLVQVLSFKLTLISLFSNLIFKESSSILNSPLLFLIISLIGTRYLFLSKYIGKLKS